MHVTKKLFTIAAAAILSISSSAAHAAPLNAETCVSSGYNCATDAYAGNAGGYADYYKPSNQGHNCTVYAAYKLYLYKQFNSAYGTLGSAETWATRAALIPGVSVSQTPHVYDVAQWNSGHVAWVEAVNTNSAGAIVSVVVTDDNYFRNVTTRKILYIGGDQSSVKWPSNFISFPSYGGGSKPWQYQNAPLMFADK